jgi:hypothetical protein
MTFERYTFTLQLSSNNIDAILLIRRLENVIKCIFDDD